MSLFRRIFSSEKKETLDKGLEKTKASFFDKLSKAVAGKSKVDDDVLDNLEEVLVTSDVGVDTTLKIIDRIEARVARDKYLGTDELNKILREEIAGLLSEIDSGNESEFEIPAGVTTPYVIMVVGVNGVGKTTTIGKLAHQLLLQGKKSFLVLPIPSVLLLSISFRSGQTEPEWKLLNKTWEATPRVLPTIPLKVRSPKMQMWS